MSMIAMPTGSTRFACVVGSPVRHSLSPVLFNSAFAAAGLDCVYLAMEVSPESLATAIMGLRALGVIGISVTMPHKEKIVPLLDEVTPMARLLKSVNVVRTVDGNLIGDTTDGTALVMALRDSHGVRLEGAQVALLGTGSAARSVALAICGSGIASVELIGRSDLGYGEMANLLSGFASLGVKVSRGDLGSIGRCEVVINATSVGMSGTASEGELPFPIELMGSGQFLYDLVYSPLETPLVKAASSAGVRCANGVSMLTQIAALAFTDWTGETAPVESMRAAVEAALAERGRPGLVE